MAALLLSLATLAHAGTYVWKITDPDPTKSTQSPTYSGGNFHCTFGGGVSYNERYGQRGLLGADGYGNGNNEGDYADCSGMITTTYTWHAGPGQTVATDPLPLYVIVMEKCHVRAYGPSATAAPVVGICDTGLGVSSALAQSKLPSGVTFGSAEWTTTRYTVATGGQTVTLTCTPRAQCSTPSAYASLLYTPAITPITVRLDGTTKDTAGSDNILIGQGCTAYIQAGSLPSGTVTFSNFAWTPQGPAVFDHFQVAVDNTTAQVVPVASGEWAKPNPHWLYLQDSGAGAYGVACTATVSVNGTALGSVNGRRDVQVWVPYYTFKPLTGPVIVDNRLGYLELYAGGPHVGNLGSNNWYPAGISNGGRVGTPALFRKPDSGSWQFIQLIHPGRWTYYVNLVGSFIEAPLNYNGLKMLDNKLPYPAASNSPSTPWPADSIDGSSTSPTYWMEDSPGTGLSDSNYRYRADETFDDFMMYKPPNNGNGVDWVPLHLFNWKWQADITKSQALWSSGWTPSLPGYVTNISSQRCITHPDWQYLLTNTGMHF